MGRRLVPLLGIGGGDQVILGADVRQILLIGGFQGRQLRRDLLGVHIPQILGCVGNIRPVPSAVTTAQICGKTAAGLGRYGSEFLISRTCCLSSCLFGCQ